MCPDLGRSSADCAPRPSKLGARSRAATSSPGQQRHLPDRRPERYPAQPRRLDAALMPVDRRDDSSTRLELYDSAFSGGVTVRL
jgi:hypothetical protein